MPRYRGRHHHGKYKSSGNADRPAITQNEREELDFYLRNRGLRRVEVDHDGNCLFSSLSDQLVGDRSFHAPLRQMLVNYMMTRGDDFAPFIDDATTLEEYCKEMRY